MIDKNKIKDYYLRNWITDAQLDRYVTLGAITQKDADEIRAAKGV